MNGVGVFLRDAWRLARPYFFRSEDRWAGRGLLAAVIGLSLLTVWLEVLLNGWRGEFYNAIQNKDWDGFISLILFYRRDEKGFTPGFTLLAFVLIAIGVYQFYLQQWLGIRWRRWLTDHFVNEWLADRAYYKISLNPSDQSMGTDNPDQRITEDVRDFCEKSLVLGLGLISRIVTLFSFLAILWGLSGAMTILGVSIPGYLLWIAIIYATLGSLITHYFGRPLAALNFRKQHVEADFRYALVRVRENVEGIAMYRGEDREKALLRDRFLALVINFRAIMSRTRLLNTVTSFYGQAAVIFPIVLVAPGYFAGKFQMGVIFQTTGAFSHVQNALSWIVDRYDMLAELRAIVARLSTFHQAIESARAADTRLVRTDSADGTVRLKAFDLALPDGTKLMENVDLTLSPGHSVVISGRSGSGKSTLFRALSGIWPFARGTIEMPARSFFLPQKPYIPLGTLRYIVTYPNESARYGTETIQAALRTVGLGHLMDQLDREDNWPQSLSGGEQQRVAVARALLARPDWIFLDEATSSLDPESEAVLYEALRSELPGTTLISIAHRTAVARFHEGQMRFRRDGEGPGTLAVEGAV